MAKSGFAIPLNRELDGENWAYPLIHSKRNPIAIALPLSKSKQMFIWMCLPNSEAFTPLLISNKGTSRCDVD